MEIGIRAARSVQQMTKMGMHSNRTFLLHCLRLPFTAMQSNSPPNKHGIEWYSTRALGLLGDMVKRGLCLCRYANTCDAYRLMDHILANTNTNTNGNRNDLDILIRCLCKEAEMEVAIDRMGVAKANACASTYNILLCILCKRGRGDVALKLYLKMLQRGFLPNMYTFKMLINCVCKKASLEEANHVFKLTLEKGFVVDAPSIYCRLIISNCKKGSLNEALRLLCDMQTRNFFPKLEIYHSLISRFCKENSTVGALSLYNEMGSRCSLQTAFCCTLHVTSLCKQDRVKEGCQLMEEALHKGIIKQADAYATVIRSLCNEGYLVEALQLCNEMEVQDKGIATGLIYNLIITGLCNEGRLVEAFRLFDNMERECDAPTLITYFTLICSVCKAGYLDEADDLLKKLLSKGLVPDLIIYNSMIDGYCKHGKVEEASKFVVEMQKCGILPDSLTLHALIKGHCRKYQVESALALFHELGRKGMIPIVFSYINIIYALCHKGRMEEASKLLEEMLDRNLLLGIHSRHRLWSEYCRRFGFMDTKESAVGSQVEVSFDDFIKIRCLQRKIQEAASILRELELRDATCHKSAEIDDLFRHQIQQDRYISEIMIGESRAHVKQMRCDRHSSDVNLYHTDSIARFCKEGKMQDALLFYDDMLKKGLVPDFSTYSGLIRSLVANNNMREANKILKDMVQPAK